MLLNELSLLIIIPLLTGIVNIVLPRLVQKILTLAAMIYCIFLVYMLYFRPPETIWLFQEPLFSLDKMGFFSLVFIQLISTIVLIFSIYGIDKESERKFFILYPLTVAFCNGVVASENSISFMSFWGLSGLAVYLFAALGKNTDSPRTAKKTFIIVGGSDVFLIMGFVLLSYLLPEAGMSLKKLHLPLTGELSYAAFIFLLIGSLAKAGGFPLHTWVPDFSKDAPVESAALLPASLDKMLGIYLLARIMTSYFTVSVIINLFIISLGALTVITAVMMAINQHNGRKLLGYHAVSQVGYMIMGVGSGNVLAFAGGLFHLVNNVLYKSGLFLSLGSVEKKTKTNELDYLGGLGKNMPLTFIAALVASLSISGIPPFNGFFSKWMIYQGLLEQTKTLSHAYQLWLIACIILAVFGSALTLASFLKFLHAVFLGRRPEIYNDIKEAPVNQCIASVLIAIACIGFGLFALPLPLTKIIYPAVSETLNAVPVFVGLYDPQFVFILFIIALTLGLIVYMASEKVRYDEVYLGGMSPSEKFRIAGTEFYNEIRNMKPLKTLYDWAEKKYFDLYELFAKMTFAVSALLQKAHPGQLQLYVLMIIAGMLVFILLI